MKSHLFSFLLVLAVLLTACVPAGTTDVALPTPGPKPSTEGALLVWERSGGFAGFCDKVIVQSTFEATVSNCKGDTMLTFPLTETQTAQLNEWLATYQPIDYTQSDPATADAMTVTLTFAGRGDQVAPEEAIQTVLWFASELATQARANLNPPPEKADAEFSRFVFRVQKTESGFLVLDLPPYVP